ncbi:MAG TPA: hypothetical protein PKY49_08145, partial [Anaerolineae bacterium]|nr:hypothetical protein [Anaerolineae bacterium]
MPDLARFNCRSNGTSNTGMLPNISFSCVLGKAPGKRCITRRGKVKRAVPASSSNHHLRSVTMYETPMIVFEGELEVQAGSP